MAIDWGAIAAAGGFGKGTPRKVAKDTRTKQRETADERENKKVRARSGGRCEVRIKGQRCTRRAWQVHHHLGGFGVRGRGASAFAVNKSHVCGTCHPLITGNVLQHVKGQQYRKVT